VCDLFACDLFVTQVRVRVCDLFSCDLFVTRVRVRVCDLFACDLFVTRVRVCDLLMLMLEFYSQNTIQELLKYIPNKLKVCSCLKKNALAKAQARHRQLYRPISWTGATRGKPMTSNVVSSHKHSALFNLRAAVMGYSKEIPWAGLAPEMKERSSIVLPHPRAAYLRTPIEAS
jgi:hypothetical protein